MKNIQELAYELYKVDWKQSHMITPEVEKDALMNYYEGLLSSDFDEEYTFEEYINEFGYSYEIYASYKEFCETEFLDKDYMRKLLNNKLFKEYLTFVEPGKDKQVIMEATFNVQLQNGEKFEDYLNGEKGYADIGGFSVIVPGYKLSIPFDFEATAVAVNDDGSYTYGNFGAVLERIYDVDPCHTDDWAENGLSKGDITARLLAGADELEDFYFNVETHSNKEVLAFLEVKEMSFTNEKDETFYIKPSVLMEFNRSRLAMQIAELMLPNEFFKIRLRYAANLVISMCDKDPNQLFAKVTAIQNNDLYANTQKQEIADFLISSMVKLSESKDELEVNQYNIYSMKPKKSFESLVKEAGEKQLSQAEEKGNVLTVKKEEDINY